MGLKSASTNGALGSGDQGEPEVNLEDLLKTSQAVEFRQGGDVVKTLAMSEDQLADMPKAKQPSQLQATLLPYQLQVSLASTIYDLFCANCSLGISLDDRKGEPGDS